MESSDRQCLANTCMALTTVCRLGRLSWNKSPPSSTKSTPWWLDGGAGAKWAVTRASRALSRAAEQGSRQHHAVPTASTACKTTSSSSPHPCSAAMHVANSQASPAHLPSSQAQDLVQRVERILPSDIILLPHPKMIVRGYENAQNILPAGLRAGHGHGRSLTPQPTAARRLTTLIPRMPVPELIPIPVVHLTVQPCLWEAYALASLAMMRLGLSRRGAGESDLTLDRHASASPRTLAFRGYLSLHPKLKTAMVCLLSEVVWPRV